MLSIIIPHYNSNDSLMRLLKSIESNVPEIEVFVVDDGSRIFPDSLKKENFTFKLEIIKNKNAKGAGGARNTALDLITTEYVIFADADDEFIADWYRIVKRYFTTSNDIVFFSPDGLKDNGSPTSRHLGYKKLVTSYKLREDSDILYKFHVPWSKLFRADFVKREKIRFDEVVASNDVMFSLKASVKARVFDVEEHSIYRVYESSSSLIKRVDFEVLNSRLRALNRYNRYLLDNVEEGKSHLISLIPIMLKLIRYFPIKSSHVIISTLVSAPAVISIQGTLRAIKRRSKGS